MIAEISSLQHPLVKDWVKLRSEKEARRERGSVLLIGEKMIRELAGKIRLQALISTQPAPDIAADKYYCASPEILQKITGLPSPDGFAAVADLPAQQSLIGKERVLILDRISDPGNLGTLLRTALALSWDGVVFTPETVDPFNDKALRASKGALFSLPHCFLDGESFLQQKNRSVYLADLSGQSLSESIFQTPFALILSNEGAGPSPWAQKRGQKICIPMQNEVESLNVAASGAILLYAMRAR